MQVKLTKDMTADRGHIFAKGSIVDFMTKVSKAGIVQIMPVDAVDEQGLPYVNAGRDTIYQLEVQASDYTVLDKDVELKKMSFNYPNSYIEKDDDDTITASLVDLYADKDFMLDSDGLVTKKAEKETEEEEKHEEHEKSETKTEEAKEEEKTAKKKLAEWDTGSTIKNDIDNVYDTNGWVVYMPENEKGFKLLSGGTNWNITNLNGVYIIVNKSNRNQKFMVSNGIIIDIKGNKVSSNSFKSNEGLYNFIKSNVKMASKKKTAETQENMLVDSNEDITTDFDPAVGGSEKGVDEAMKNQIANPDESTKPVTDLFSNPLTAGIKKLEEMKDILAKEDNNLVDSDDDITTDFDPAVGGSGKLPAYPHGESASEGWKDKYLGETL